MSNGFDSGINHIRKVAEISKTNNPDSVGHPGSSASYILKLEPCSIDPRKSNFALIDENYNDWHERFGHAGVDAIKELKRLNLVEGMTIATKEELSCNDCCNGKLCRKPHP